MKHHIVLAALATALTLASPALAGPNAATPSLASRQQTVVHHATASQRQSVEDLYRSAQLKLKDMRLYNGAIDGLRNTAFVTSLERFQRSHNIRANGRLNSETRAALGI